MSCGKPQIDGKAWCRFLTIPMTCWCLEGVIIEFVFMALRSSDRKDMIYGKLAISTRKHWKAKFLEQSLFGNCSAGPDWCCEMKKTYGHIGSLFWKIKTLFSISNPSLTHTVLQNTQLSPLPLGCFDFRQNGSALEKFASSCTCILKPYLSIGKYSVPYS